MIVKPMELAFSYRKQQKTPVETKLYAARRSG
jgi:hypothetical protein